MAKGKGKSKTLLGVKITKNDLSDEEWGVIHRFALALEKGRFNEYVDILQDNKKLLWKGFLNGLARGFGAVVGATLVVAIVVALLGILGAWVPGDVGDFFRNTGDKIEQPVK